MDDTPSTVAVVGVCGGAGATRLTVEVAATLARTGRDVLAFDVAFATQGLVDYVPGDVDPDATAVLADDEPLAEATVDLPWETDGRVAACPARAPFERFARAGTAGAARSLESALASASDRFDVVLVDAPPVSTNPAVAAVTTADRVGLVAPASGRGVNALQRVRGRLADVGADADVVVANRADGENTVGSADVAVPESDASSVERAPAVLDPDAAFAPSVARASEALVDDALDLSFPEKGLLERLS
ncbi:hypothetical protein BRC81_07090 [Halobacteriales archaeon QS_1_68_20]|nr:MAG: hypothetical protein BRC81_07090 [Halobacteriales archaeon QS_1_68_20]